MPVFFLLTKVWLDLKYSARFIKNYYWLWIKNLLDTGEREKRIWKFRRANVKVLLDDTSIGPR